MKSGVLEPLTKLAMMEGVELEIQRYAVLAIANLATDDETHEDFIEQGMLAKLVSLSNSPNDEIRQFSAFSLVKMSQNSDVRQVVVQNGGLEPVLYLARTESSDIQREVVPSLCCLSFDGPSKLEIAKFGGLPPIMAALAEANSKAPNSYAPRAATPELTIEERLMLPLGQKKDEAIISVKDNFMSVPQLQRLCCATIANLAEDSENFDVLVEGRVIPQLLMALTTSHDAKRDTAMVRREAARALGNLSAAIHIGAMILGEGAQVPLLALLAGECGDQCSRMAAMALANLSSNMVIKPSTAATPCRLPGQSSVLCRYTAPQELTIVVCSSFFVRAFHSRGGTL